MYFSSFVREREGDGNAVQCIDPSQPASSAAVSCFRPVAADSPGSLDQHHKQSHGRKPPSLIHNHSRASAALVRSEDLHLLGFSMAEAEPGATEEQAEVGEEPVEVAEQRVSLTNVVGSVFRAHRLDIGQGLCVSVVIWTLLSDL